MKNIRMHVCKSIINNRQSILNVSCLEFSGAGIIVAHQFIFSPINERVGNSFVLRCIFIDPSAANEGILAFA